MLNSVSLTGRLTKDPEIKFTQNNKAVCNFTLAVNRTFTDQNGERSADFINCVTFNNKAENMGKFLRKGSLIGVSGRLQTRSYDNNEGQRIFVTEVVSNDIIFLDTKNNDQQQNNQYQQNQQANNQYQQQNNQYQQQRQQPQPNQQYGQQNQYGNNSVDINDDDLPF